MYKTELIRRVSKETRLSQRIISDVIEASHRLIEQTLREGNSVTFPGFGTFLTREKKEGQVKDVRTGELVRYEYPLNKAGEGCGSYAGSQEPPRLSVAALARSRSGSGGT